MAGAIAFSAFGLGEGAWGRGSSSAFGIFCDAGVIFCDGRGIFRDGSLSSGAVRRTGDATMDAADEGEVSVADGATSCHRFILSEVEGGNGLSWVEF